MRRDHDRFNIRELPDMVPRSCHLQIFESTFWRNSPEPTVASDLRIPSFVWDISPLCFYWVSSVTTWACSLFGRRGVCESSCRRVVVKPAVPPEVASSPVLETSVVGPSVGETKVVVFVMMCLTNRIAQTFAAMRGEHPVGQMPSGPK